MNILDGVVEVHQATAVEQSEPSKHTKERSHIRTGAGHADVHCYHNVVRALHLLLQCSVEM